MTTEWPLTLELPATKYHVNIWADYTTDGESDLYYCADTFSEITLNGSYAGNNTAKDAFFSSETLDLSDLDLNYMDFELERPVARWILLQYPYDSTSDEAANFSYNIVTYSGFTPCAFNLFTSKPNDATGGLNFLAYKVTDIMPNTDYADELGDDEYLLLAYDYVFADSDTTTVTVVVYTYNKAGEIIVTSSAFDITLVRGKQTIIKGDFITPSSSGDGIGINPEMYGDYNIEFS